MVNQEQRETALLWTLDSLNQAQVAVPIIAKYFSAEDWAFMLEGMPKGLRLTLW
jgi:magnesium transporter